MMMIEKMTYTLMMSIRTNGLSFHQKEKSLSRDLVLRESITKTNFTFLEDIKKKVEIFTKIYSFMTFRRKLGLMLALLNLVRYLAKELIIL